MSEGEAAKGLWYCAKCGYAVTSTARKYHRYEYPCPRCENPWWNFTQTRPVFLSHNLKEQPNE